MGQPEQQLMHREPSARVSGLPYGAAFEPQDKPDIHPALVLFDDRKAAMRGDR
jgi:hypothetical protein